MSLDFFITGNRKGKLCQLLGFLVSWQADSDNENLFIKNKDQRYLQQFWMPTFKHLWGYSYGSQGNCPHYQVFLMVNIITDEFLQLKFVNGNR